MDPLTALLIATLMMLLNGGVLGLMHRDLPASLRPSAVSWRIATLLQAAGCVLLAVQNYLPTGFVLPIGNALLALGIAGYWRALRQFYGQPDSWWLLLPVVLCVLGIWWFAVVQPNLNARVLIASVCWVLLLLGGVHALSRPLDGDSALSRRVLAVIFLVLAGFMVLRAVWAALSADMGTTLLNSSSWTNMATPMLAAILPVIGTTAFLLLCSERIRRQWERAASTDYLTGLANRRTVAEAGAKRIASVRREGVGLAVAAIDIDHFKSVNDRFGHEVGDLVLKLVASQIQAVCREVDLAGRQGGEEFVVLLAAGGVEQALAAAERLRQSVRSTPFQLDSTQPLTITVSIGVAVLKEDEQHLDDLLRRADRALYQAKSSGRDRVDLAA